MRPQEEDTLLEVSNVARRLGVSVPTVYRLIKKGELRAHKYGGGYRLNKTEVEAYRNRYYQPN